VPSEAANPSWQIGLVSTSQKQKRTAIKATPYHTRRFIGFPWKPGEHLENGNSTGHTEA
jgi:hypothetical protein